MTSTHDRRLAALEAERVGADVELGVLMIPPGLMGDGARAWIDARCSTDTTASGVVVIPHKGAIR